MMTRQEETGKIAKTMQQTLGMLYGRWQDEKEYENFNDYIAVAKEGIEAEGGEFVGMTKRPFRVLFKVQGVLCYIKITSRDYEWGRMGNSTHK